MIAPLIFILENSQILPRDYVKQVNIELILREMAEQVAICLRRVHKKCGTASISVYFSKHEMKRPIQTQMKLESTKLDRLTLITQLYFGRLIGIFEVKFDNRKE